LVHSDLRGSNNADFPITRVPVDREQACTFANPQGNTPRDGVLFLDGSRGSNGLGSNIPRRSGSLDPSLNTVPNSDQTAPSFGNLAGLGSAIPWSGAHQGSISDSLFDWLQMALADNGARLLAGTLPGWTPQPGQTRELGAFSPRFPQTQTTQTPPPVPVPMEDLLPEALKPLVPIFFPQGLGSNDTRAWPPAGTPDGSPAQPNAAGSAGAGPSPTPAPPSEALLPEPLRRLVPFFFPKGPDG
jgi:hypothetical protein